MYFCVLYSINNILFITTNFIYKKKNTLHNKNKKKKVNA